MLKLYASDPLYAEWHRLLNQRAQLVNAAVFWDLCQIPELERRVMVAKLTEAVEEAHKELTR